MVLSIHHLSWDGFLYPYDFILGSINTWWVDKQVNCLTSKSPIHRCLLKPWSISNNIETRSLG